MTSEEAIKVLNDPTFMWHLWRVEQEEAIAVATEALEQQKVGRWVCLRDQYDDIVDAVCSKCDAHGYDKWAYCPECGAKMAPERSEHEVRQIKCESI